MMIENFLVDFDGVIFDSLHIKGLAFAEVLQDRYPKNYCDKIYQYHMNNGGINRKDKFIFFYKNIAKENVKLSQIEKDLDKFSKIMSQRLFDTNLLIDDSINFIRENQELNFHIISSAESNELDKLANFLDISFLFKSINGSIDDKCKKSLELIEEHSIARNNCLFIGDSVQDKQAADCAEVLFLGYNNMSLEDCHLIKSFNEILSIC